jgi:hypothetical protein
MTGREQQSLEKGSSWSDTALTPVIGRKEWSFGIYLFGRNTYLEETSNSDIACICWFPFSVDFGIIGLVLGVIGNGDG